MPFRQENNIVIIGKNDLTEQLRALGVKRGDGLFVHTALGQIGHVIGGPRGLIEALLETVGDQGLIGMPGFSRDAYDPDSFIDGNLSLQDHRRITTQVPGFDPERSSVSQNGAVPEAFRSWPGIVRSNHPTSSVLLLGRDAQEIAAGHDPHDWATGPRTPWARLKDRPAMKILLIGVGWDRCSAFHAAESAAAHRRSVMRDIKHGANGAWIKAPDVADDLGRLFPLVGKAWEDTGAVVTGMIGNANCRLAGYGALLSFATDWIDRQNQRDGVNSHQP